MKRSILVAGLLFASASAVHAETYYSVVEKAGQEVGLGVIDLPAVITGRVSSASSTHLVSFQVRSGDERGQAAIYTNTGTGAVFRALLSIGEEDELDISSSKSIPFNRSTPYVLVISAETYQEGASYAVRLGTFGDFSVYFDGNGGTVSTTNKVYRPGEPYGEFPTATRTNYTFSGWSTAVTNGIVLTTNTQVCVGYTKLYAQWMIDPTPPLVPTNETPAVTNCYYVAFNSNGGTGTMPNQTFTIDEARALATNAFTHAGFDFSGWATSPTGDVAYADCAIVTNLAPVGATNTLYACWTRPFSSACEQEVDGVLWHYTITNGVATIQNVSGGAHVAAVDTSVRGTLTIPAMFGTNMVERIGERAFSGCSSVTNIVIPLGVTSIGNYAFADCTSLSPGITIPESVETMGAYVFTNCPNLKIVRYLGNCPDAHEALYVGTASTLISGVLRVRSGWPMNDGSGGSASVFSGGDGDDEGWDDDEGGVDDDDEGDTSSGGGFAPWPEGDYARRVFVWVTQPVFRVTFWVARGMSNSKIIRYYIPGRVVGSLPEDPGDLDGYTFLGWYTKPYGGTQVTEEMVVNSSFSVYAHWRKDDDPESLSDVEYDFASAYSYDGYLLDDGKMAGTILFKTSKARRIVLDGETTVPASATIVLLGEGRIRMRGTLGEDLSGTLTSGRLSDGRELEVTSLSGSALEGTFGNYTVVGTRDIFGKKTYLDRVKSKEVDDNWKGNYVVLLKAESDESDSGSGYVGLSVQVRANGRASVAGAMPDGTRVSCSGRLEVHDGNVCELPVVAPLHAGKKGGFGFLLTFSEDFGVSASSESDWTNPSASFTSALEIEGAGRAAGLSQNATFALGDSFEGIEAESDLLPAQVEVSVSGSRWATPKADRLKFSAEDAAYEILTEYGNPSGLTLSAAPTKGTFKGRFKVFAVTEAGKSKKYTAVVNGAVLDGVGYGTATIRKIGSVPVTVNPE